MIDLVMNCPDESCDGRVPLAPRSQRLAADVVGSCPTCGQGLCLTPPPTWHRRRWFRAVSTADAA